VSVGVSQPPRSLSVVVPSRNTRQLTLACLATLAAAAAARPELAALEVVLVDDAGDDGTAEAVAARHPEVRLVRLERQGGFTRAANRGLATAAGGVLLLLNSDAEVADDGSGLAALLARFAAEPRLGIAGAALRYPDGTPQWSGGAAPTAAWMFALASGLPELLARMPLYRRLRPASGTRAAEVAWVTGAAMAIRRAAWDEVGPLDETFHFYAQDLDLCLRAHQAGWTVAVVPEFEVIHHHGATILAEGGRGGRGARRGGGRRGAVHPELLWTDLLRWARKQGGEPAARRAARALLAGGRLRLLGRRLAGPLVPAAERERYRADSAAYGSAVAAMAAMTARHAARP
jgi:N-acetylglucosaminyl-diphospho-decaprenol L-rhamnosyltransferase